MLICILDALLFEPSTFNYGGGKKKREYSVCGKGQEGWVREEGKGNYSREPQKKARNGWHMGKFLNERKRGKLKSQEKMLQA